MRELKALEHGTVEMYRRERHAKQGTCPECRAAQAQYIAEYRKTTRRNRDMDVLQTTQRRRALTRLARAHPQEYLRYLAEEKAQR